MAKKSHKGKKQYGMYANELRFAKNKALKLAKHLKKHPNDASAIAAAKAKVGTPSRKKPLTRPWKSESDQILARISSGIKGMMRADSYLFNTNKPGLVRGINPVKAMKAEQVKAAVEVKVAA